MADDGAALARTEADCVNERNALAAAAGTRADGQANPSNVPNAFERP